MIVLYVLLVYGWIFKPVTTHDLGKDLHVIEILTLGYQHHTKIIEKVYFMTKHHLG